MSCGKEAPGATGLEPIDSALAFDFIGRFYIEPLFA